MKLDIVSSGLGFTNHTKRYYSSALENVYSDEEGVTEINPSGWLNSIRARPEKHAGDKFYKQTNRVTRNRPRVDVDTAPTVTSTIDLRSKINSSRYRLIATCFSGRRIAFN